MYSETSYPYAVGVIKARERSLIDAALWARLQEAPTEEALKLLIDFGYGGGETGDIDTLIRAELDASRRLIAEIAPDPTLIGVLLIDTDAHNLKVLFKGRLLESDETQLLLSGGAIDKELLTACVQNGEYSSLPEPLCGSLEAIEQTLTPDTRVYELCAAVDNAVYGYALSLLTGRKAAPFAAYLRARMDVTNVLAFLRAQALSMEAAELRAMLLSGGTVPPEDLIRLYAQSEEEQRRFLRAGENGSLIEKVLSVYDKEHDITAAESAANDGLQAMLGQEKDDSFGIGPLLYYLIQKQAQAKKLRLLFAQKRAAAQKEAD
ncbi:MAG: V-type ATPase subunit [Acutalibacteraceae bacterium]